MTVETPDPGCRRLLEDKAEKLEDLRKRKPGQKNYKRSLRAFLEADAKAQKALLARIGRLAAPQAGATETASPEA
jgi:hypothetical protein